MLFFHKELVNRCSALDAHQDEIALLDKRFVRENLAPLKLPGEVKRLYRNVR